MRLIIGYNERDREIIFSDSWGAGHEKKVLPLEDAYCMTNGIYSIRPIKQQYTSNDCLGWSRVSHKYASLALVFYDSHIHNRYTSKN